MSFIAQDGRYLTADNIHSVILLAGMFAVINVATVLNVTLVEFLLMIAIWTFGYYMFVTIFVPEKWSP